MYISTGLGFSSLYSQSCLLSSVWIHDAIHEGMSGSCSHGPDRLITGNVHLTTSASFSFWEEILEGLDWRKINALNKSWNSNISYKFDML